MEEPNKTEQVEKDVPESDCIEWLEDFIKAHGAVRPKEAFAAGAKAGFTQDGIKAARRYFGTLIETRRNSNGESFWTWKP